MIECTHTRGSQSDGSQQEAQNAVSADAERSRWQPAAAVKGKLAFGGPRLLCEISHNSSALRAVAASACG